jgi:hypothetical protein
MPSEKRETIMINLNCEKCGQCYRIGDEYAGRKVRCSKCGHIHAVPELNTLSIDLMNGIPYAADGITPDFNALFMALLKQEREAPTLELAHR